MRRNRLFGSGYLFWAASIYFIGSSTCLTNIGNNFTDPTTVSEEATTPNQQLTDILTDGPIITTSVPISKSTAADQDQTSRLTTMQPKQYVDKPSVDSVKIFNYSLCVDATNDLDELNTVFTDEVGKYYEETDIEGYTYLLITNIEEEENIITINYSIVYNYTKMAPENRNITAKELIESTGLVEKIDSGILVLEVNDTELNVTCYKVLGEEYQVNCAGCNADYDCMVEDGVPYCKLSNQQSGDGASTGLADWHIALITVGGVLFIAVITIGIVYGCSKSKKSNRTSPGLENDKVKLSEEQGTSKVNSHLEEIHDL